MKLRNTLCALAALAMMVTAASAQEVTFDATITASGATSDSLASLPIDLDAARDVLGWQLPDDGWAARVVDAQSGEPAPYVLVRARLEALINRAVFYDLVALGTEEEVDGVAWFGVWSAGTFFPFRPAGELAV